MIKLDVSLWPLCLKWFPCACSFRGFVLAEKKLFFFNFSFISFERTVQYSAYRRTGLRECIVRPARWERPWDKRIPACTPSDKSGSCLYTWLCRKGDLCIGSKLDLHCTLSNTAWQHNTRAVLTTIDARWNVSISHVQKFGRVSWNSNRIPIVGDRAPAVSYQP